MRVLAIANSFGVDANRYLNQIARSAGMKINVSTLFVGYCTLKMHYQNMVEDKREYDLFFNGIRTGFKTSLSEALSTGKWDVITLQQASFDAHKPETYFPYAKELYDYIRSYQPDAKVLIHQTWAYESGSEKLADVGYETAEAMFADMEKAYQKCHDELGTDGIIPSGKLMLMLQAKGIRKVYRDSFHASLGIGRYALALLWFRMLTGQSVADIAYSDFDEDVFREEIRIVKEIVSNFQPISLS